MEKNKALNMVEETLRCKICLEECVDHKKLKCQHIFCSQCLQQYVNEKGEIHCPVCLRCCSIPNDKVGDLPASFLFFQIKARKDMRLGGSDVEFETEKKVEIQCSINNCMNLSTAFCKMCKYISNTCKDEHTKTSLVLMGDKSHEILTLEEGLNLEKEALSHCPQHPAMILQMYCETCSIPYCVMCHSHTSHQFVELDKKSEEGRKVLENVLLKVTKYMQTAEEKEQSMNNHSTRLTMAADELKQNMSKKIENIQQELIHHKETIQMEVEKSHEQAGNKQDLMINEINVTRMSLKSLQFCANLLLLYGEPCDYVTKVTPIEERLRNYNPGDLKLSLPELNATEAEKKIDDLEVCE